MQQNKNENERNHVEKILNNIIKKDTGLKKKTVRKLCIVHLISKLNCSKETII